MVKNTGDVRDVGLIPGLGRSPGEGNAEGNGVRKCIPVFLPGKPHGQGNPAGYNSWGGKESDTTEHTYTHTQRVLNFNYIPTAPFVHLISHFRLHPNKQIGEGNGTPLHFLAWKIPWMEEPGGLQSMGSLRVRHD